MSPRQKECIRRAFGMRMHVANMSMPMRLVNTCRRNPQATALADKKGALATTDVPSAARAPTRGEPYGARGTDRGQEPDKGNAGEERERLRQPQGLRQRESDALCAITAAGVIQSGYAIQTRPSKRFSGARQRPTRPDGAKREPPRAREGGEGGRVGIK